MIVILAEKPSVGKDIARVLGVSKNHKGYMVGGGYAVTWAFGHLAGLAMPEEYNEKKYTKEDLPIIPEPFKLVVRKTRGKDGYLPDEAAAAQLKVIGKLFKECDSIIVATDAGREGELIFRNIYNYLKCRKPFSRLWISSLTDSAIREGLKTIRDGKEFDGLYLSAEARSKADWLVGINTSRALSYCTGDNNNSLGRVQTPTLAMICRRYHEHTGFEPQPFWELLIRLPAEEALYVGCVDPYFDRKEAEEAYEKLKQQHKALVKAVENNTHTEQPPLLYDLAALQKAANTKYGYSADKTLSVAQKLYEGKYISYPRTGSRYIPEDVFETIPALLDDLKACSQYSEQAEVLSGKELNKRSVNASKVTDHHGLLVTGIIPEGLDTVAENIYALVAFRTIVAFAPACKKNSTTIDIECGGIIFRTKGWVVTEQGWRSICGEEPEEKEERLNLPDLQEGETIDVLQHNMIGKSTKPKPIYTDASLLTAMETCGKNLEDEQARNALKHLGIGTAATRAAIIETLLSRGYVIREKKNLIPTQKGMAIYKAVKSMRIADVEMTGQWETAISKIESQPEYYNTFLQGMKIHTRQMTDEILSMGLNKDSYQASSYICPRCRLGKMVFYPKIIRCNNTVCKHILYRKICDKVLSDEQLSELLKKGRTKPIKGFKGKKEQPFEASLAFDKDYKIIFDFSDSNKKNNGKRKKT